MISRSDRNRELIENSAALLAADYPFDVLIERLCTTIAEVLQATVYVALPDAAGTLRLSYMSERGERRETHERVMPEASRVAHVFRSGRSIVIHDARAEREDNDDVDAHGRRRTLLSAIYAPIAYGDAMLGVLSVQHQDAAEFSRDDLRVVESMARHLAIAIRSGHSSGPAPARYPWLAFAAIGALALVATGITLAGARPSAALAILWPAAIVLAVVAQGVYAKRRDAAGATIQRALRHSEIATRMDAEEQLRAAAYHDALTGLPNRAFFLNQLGDVIEQRRMQSGGEYAVLFVDLDRFYVVNDSMGHNVGDQLLAAIAYRLEEAIPPHALIARLGGDEFVLLLPALESATHEAIAIAEDILDALRNPFRLGEREVYSGASIGIVKVDDGYEDSETILRDADISMYHAKRSGRARYAVFDHAMRERVTQQLELEGSLRGAVDRGEIVAFYQPIVRVRDESVVGFEALARWHRDGGGDAVSAGEFVPLAELTGMMRAIDAELFAQVCRDVGELAALAPDLRVSVNVSANDLTRASLLADIDSTLERFSVPASAFRIEITETAVMEDAERALEMLGELRARGLEIVVDDFGVGYSSLSYLQRLPLAGVKIDRSFIVSLPGNGQALEIVRAIVALAKTLGLHVTAEGVEREEQLRLLHSLGVDYAQGYWFSPPVDFETAKTTFAVRS